MSSSLQSKQRIESRRSMRAPSFSDKGQWWEELPAILTCPECGEKAMRRVTGACRLLDGTIVPELERFQCSACQANFFDTAAMKKIDVFRKADQQKHGRQTRTKRLKAGALA